MKLLHEQTHYEVLDVSPNASAYEIGRAHQEVRSLYGERALASYSFFSAQERKEVLARIEQAYNTLSDIKLRAAYDRSIGFSQKPDTSPFTVQSNGNGNGDNPVIKAETALREKIRRGIINGDAKRITRRLAGAELVTGHDLKLLRQAIGLGVEEIEAGSTVGAGLIPALEEDRLEDLPSWLNLRNSLMVYTELLQADTKKIISGYMAWFTSRE